MNIRLMIFFSIAFNLFAVSQATAIPFATNYDYDEINGIFTATDANNKRTKYSYDSLNKLTRLELLDEVGGVSVFTYEYDNANRLTRTTFPPIGGVAESRYRYDDLDRLAGISVFGINDAISIDYDHKDRPTWINYGNGGGQVCYQYDPDGKITRVGRILSGDSAVSCGAANVEKTDYTYDSKGRIQLIVYPNKVTTEYTYDPSNGLLNSVTHKNGSNQLIFSDSYTYKPGTSYFSSESRTTPAGTNSVKYTYDSFSRLSTVEESSGKTTTYSYDSFGNRTQEMITNKLNPGATGGVPKAYGNYVYQYEINSNLLKSVTKDGNMFESFGYDNTGRIVERISAVKGITKYTYDDRGNLTKIETPLDTISYQYDANNSRQSKTVNGQTTFFITAKISGQEQVVMEVDAQKAISSVFVYGGAGLLKEEPQIGNRSEDRYWLKGGTVGNLVQSVDGNGVAKDNYSYDAFGNISITPSTSQIIRPNGYAGERYEPKSNLVYLRARYYDPSIGRFISADPYPGSMQEPISQNSYVYVKNNPIGLVDPSGLCYTSSESVGKAHYYNSPYYIAIGGATICNNGEYVGSTFFIEIGKVPSTSKKIPWLEFYDKPLADVHAVEPGFSSNSKSARLTLPQDRDAANAQSALWSADYRSNYHEYVQVGSGNESYYSIQKIVPDSAIKDLEGIKWDRKVAQEYFYNVETCEKVGCSDSDIEELFSKFMDYKNLGGVLLDQTLTLLNGIDDIKGAVYDPLKGELVFVGQGVVPINEQIDLDDLVVALRSIYINHSSPGVTFDNLHPDIPLPQNQWAVRYFGNTEGTRFGQVLFDSDYLLKELTLGVTKDGVSLAKLNPIFDANSSQYLGYKSYAELKFQNNIALNDGAGTSMRVEFYFRPLAVTLEESKDGNTERDKRSFVFTDVRMQVVTHVIDQYGYRLEYDSVSNQIVKKDPSLPLAQQEVGRITNAAAVSKILAVINISNTFAGNISQNYDAYSNVTLGLNRYQDFTVLKKLKRLGKITALVRWLYENEIPVDLSFMDSYVPKPADPNGTPDRIGILQACKDPVTGGVADVNSGPYNPVNCLTSDKVLGGVLYDVANCPSASDPTQSAGCNVVTEDPIISAALASSNRQLNPQSPADMQWNFGMTGYTAIAQALSKSYKSGNVEFTSLDLSFPNKKGLPLSFVRYYDSFSDHKGNFGPGWSQLPYNLIFPEPVGSYYYCSNYFDVVFNKAVCQSAGPIELYPVIHFVDRTIGKTLRFVPVGLQTWNRKDATGAIIETVSKPYYMSDKSNDLIYETATPGHFIVQQLDSQNNEIQNIIMAVRGSVASPKLYADPTDIIRSAGVASDGTLQEDRIKFDYDVTSDKLIAIIGDSDTPSAPYRITINYNQDLISDVSFAVQQQVRSVSYAYVNGRLNSVTSPERTIQYNYYDPPFAQAGDYSSGLIANIVDVSRGGEIVGQINNWDLENRANQSQFQSNMNVAKTTTYDRVAGITETTQVDSSGNPVVYTIVRDDRQRVTEERLKATINGLPKTLSNKYVYGDVNPLAGATQVTNERGDITQMTYDDAGQIASVTNPKLQTTKIKRGVDSSDKTNMLIVIDPLSRTSAIKYDNYGRKSVIFRRIDILSETADPNTGTVNFTYQVAPGYEAYVRRFNYDDSGNLISVTQTASALSSKYDWISGDETITLGAYNQFGQVQSITSAAGMATTFNYDELGRIKGMQFPYEITPTSVDYYNSGPNQDHVQRITSGVGQANYSYDYVNRTSTLVGEDGVTTRTTYNEFGQIAQVDEISIDSSNLTTKYNYNNQGQLIGKTLPNGSQMEYAYDGLGRVSQAIVYEAQVNAVNIPAQGCSAFDTAGNCCPTLLDADNDGVVDCQDAFPTNPAETLDTDGDGIGNNADPDDDNDGIPDTWEISHGLNPLDATDAALDNDKDGLSNLLEYIAGSDPANPDSDNDGVLDGMDAFPINPLETVDTDGDGIGNNADPDDDNDGMPDTWEITYLFDPLNPADANIDTDKDGLINVREYQLGTLPRNPDTDGDGMNDGDEVAAGRNPLVADSTPPIAANTYQITLLPLLNTGTTVTNDEARLINSQGLVVGNSSGAPVLWNNGQAIDLRQFGLSQAFSINGAGRIAGYSLLSGFVQASFYEPLTASILNLGNLGGSYSMAYSINSSTPNVVVGRSLDASGQFKGFIWKDDGNSMVDIGFLGTRVEVLPLSVNDSGWVVGWARTNSADTKMHAFVRDPQTGTLSDIGTSAGACVGDASIAQVINNVGKVLGRVTSSIGAAGCPAQFIYDSTTRMVSALPIQSLNGMNNLGTLVGADVNASNQMQGFIYDLSKGQKQYLLTSTTNPAGWTELMPNSINDSGQIVGWGRYNGDKRAFLLSPQ